MAARWEVPRFSHKLSGQGRTYTDVALVFFVGWVRYPDHQVGLVRRTTLVELVLVLLLLHHGKINLSLVGCG